MAIEKRKEAQKQLVFAMKSIQAAEEEVKKIQEENDLKLTEMVSVLEVTNKFVLSEASVFILRIFQSLQAVKRKKSCFKPVSPTRLLC